MTAIVLGLLALWIGTSAVAEQQLFHPRHWGIGPNPSERGWAYQDVSFRDPAGFTLHGWWIPGTGDRTVVMLHGWTSSRREPYDKSGYLHAAGLNLLVFDFRGSGQSGGGYTTIGWSEPQDAKAAIAYARTRTTGPIALLGYSMGASTALEEAAHDPNVSAVIADSPFSDLGAETRASFERWTHLPFEPFGLPLQLMVRWDLHFSPDQVRPITAAAHLDKPLLVIVGTADKTVPPSMGESIYAAAVAPKELLVVKGAGHTGAYNVATATYERTVLDFIDRTLG